MMTKYGEISSSQISSVKLYLRKQIFYLLLYVDPNEQAKYEYVDVNEAFDHVFSLLVGLNKILLEPPELLITLGYLENARIIYNGDKFDWASYRKMILDAGSKIMEGSEGGGSNGHH